MPLEINIQIQPTMKEVQRLLPWNSTRPLLGQVRKSCFDSPLQLRNCPHLTHLNYFKTKKFHISLNSPQHRLKLTHNLHSNVGCSYLNTQIQKLPDIHFHLRITSMIKTQMKITHLKSTTRRINLEPYRKKIRPIWEQWGGEAAAGAYCKKRSAWG